MKKRAIIVCISTVLFFIFLGARTFVLSGADADIARISAAVIKRAYNTIGIKVTFKFLPAERSLVKANDGFYDGEIMRVGQINDMYENLVKIPIPINYLSLITLSRNDIGEVQSWDDLKPYLIGIRRGVKFVEIKTAGMKVHVGNDFPELIELLINKRIDCVIISDQQVLKYMRTITDNKLILHETHLDQVPVFHYVHKKNAKMIPALMEELKRMEEAGEIEAIIQQEETNLLYKYNK